MKKTIAILMAAVLTLSIAIGALSLSAYAATDDNQYGGGAEDIEALQLAPLNPDFVAYWENLPDEFYGDVPPPMDLSHLDQLPVEGLQISDTLPSSFDWRDHGKVTPVKNQNPCGTCWDFAATSALESSVLIGESVAFDFSEQSVALCVDRSWVYLYDAWDDPCKAGGNCWLASEVFIRKGSVLETCNPYNGYALQCDGSCVCDSCPAIKKVDGFRVAAWDGSQIDTIKNAIYNNGPAKLSYNHSSSYEYWDPTWGAIYDYYPCPEGTNHAVTVVGWDDDVPHPNPSHGGTGAWIIKNSWGTSDSWAGGAGVSDGYFYLAYHSSCVQRIIHLEYKDPVSGEELLYWDEAGQVSAVGCRDNDAWMASVFTADQASILTHVDFWTTSNNAQYKIYVWDGFFGTQLAHQTGTCQEDGYYSIPLSAPISIDAGQQFTVGVDMTTPGYNYPISIEKEILGWVDPPIQSDVSFVRHTGSDPWMDLGDYGWNACLRARMVSEIEKPDLVIEEKWEEWTEREGYYNVSYVMHNKGTAPAPASHHTTLYVDGVAVEHKHVPVELKPCDTYMDTFDTRVKCTPPGDIIKVCADNCKTIDELDEKNNCLENEWPCVCKPSIDVNKTVWDSETRKWVDEVTVQVCDTVRFRCEIHNDGTCCDLTNIIVKDILSDSLEYQDNAMVDGKPWEPVKIGDNEYLWEFPDTVLSPCETITIEFDAHAAKLGEDVNTQYAKGLCEKTGTPVYDEDTATVIVTEGPPPENEVYFDPQESSAMGYCKTTEVEIWVNATGFKSGQINLTYDSGCANVTNYVWNAVDFPISGWTHYDGREWITFMTVQPSLTGNYQIGTLTIHCVNDDSAGCTTPLDFVEPSALFDSGGNKIEGVDWKDGTFECIPGICGDVNRDDEVNMGDVGALHNHVQYGYPISDEWAADVNCADGINMGDVGALHNHVQYGYPLNCC